VFQGVIQKACGIMSISRPLVRMLAILPDAIIVLQRPIWSVSVLTTLLVFVSACWSRATLVSVPNTANSTLSSTPPSEQRHFQSLTVGKAYALQQVKEVVATLTPKYYRNVRVTGHEISYEQYFGKREGYSNRVTWYWRPLKHRWSDFKDCYIYLGSMHATCEERYDNSRTGLLKIGIPDRTLADKFIAGARVLSGLDPDPNPAPYSEVSPQVDSERTISGCQKDTDCKGDRICEAGRCVNP